ncbi:MAG: 2-succinyl-6-hydroxy-2,4-cyclohexadiene-1-carboxylate synthase [Candidatus Marinimicrobia bacterium]|nr:2-succinyl-6-hydroxy-2,4-cyclohexadiene-1-carboxylate synthase [Candidatus Neomarinimicrobiota bacterium]MCF7841001.1 2-succinyl-6-hydroxy-2,4-cyclohexadiene-1-carboxylate synthase [Candidatus Neomarinimicrobiota bacterium]
MKLACRTWGSAEKPVLLMLHGFMGSGADWDPVAESLCDDFYCLAPDLPGHGATDMTGISQDNAFDETAAAIVNLLAEMDITEAVLLGYSMGGRMGWYTALKYPEWFTGLILESASPGLKTPDERAARLEIDLERAEALRNGNFEAFLEQWYNQPLFRSMARRGEQLASLKKSRLTKSPNSLADALDYFSVARQPGLWDQSRALLIPVLMIVGEFDEKYRGIAGEIAATCLRRANVRIIPQAGHNTHWEAKENFIQAVESFFETELNSTRRPL